PLAALTTPGIEVELCLRVDGDGAVTGVAPAFELTDKRIRPGADDGTVLADGSSNWGIVLGEFVPVPDVELTWLEATLWRGDEVADVCLPGDTMDDPMLSLRRLTERLAEYGRGLTAGQAVITGSIVKAAVAGPGPWRGEIERLGSVEMTFV